jgi:hypothetical protein
MTYISIWPVQLSGRALDPGEDLGWIVCVSEGFVYSLVERPLEWFVRRVSCRPSLTPPQRPLNASLKALHCFLEGCSVPLQAPSVPLKSPLGDSVKPPQCLLEGTQCLLQAPSVPP